MTEVVGYGQVVRSLSGRGWHLEMWELSGYGCHVKPGTA